MSRKSVNTPVSSAGSTGGTVVGAGLGNLAAPAEHPVLTGRTRGPSPAEVYSERQRTPALTTRIEHTHAWLIAHLSNGL